MVEEIRGTGVRAEWYSGWGPDPGGDQYPIMYRILVMRTGWPLPAFQFETTLEAEGLGFLIPMELDTRWVSGLEVPDDWLPEAEATSDAPRNRRIPVRPCWPGFLMDTMLMTGLMTLVIQGPSVLRRWRRRRRGLCLACGYSREGIPADGACPECNSRRQQ
jgi:hypothetical protein